MTQFSLAHTSPLLAPGFTMGVATSSFQIEGATGKAEPCIWDRFCAQPGAIRDASDGLVACQHVELWQQDIDLIAGLGVDAYRFSVAWGRVMHRDGSLNPEGIAFYINILDALAARGIKAYVTLYHWDLPAYLEDQGGWLSRETAYRFRDYVRAVTEAFGDRVYSYATLNEPFCSAYLGYEVGIHAPGKASIKGGRQAAHHLLLAHGLAMQVLKQSAPNAEHGIVLNFSPTYPATDCDDDRQAAMLADEKFNHWYIQPLLEGKYPAYLQRLSSCDRPDIEEGDMAIIAQPLDFIGINYYTRMRCTLDSAGEPMEVGPPTGAETTAMGWEVYSQGLTDLLTRLHSRFSLPPLLITENGAATDDELVDGAVVDEQRCRYLQHHFEAVEKAILAGVDIRGYFVWSLMDNFEWAEGYAKRFGIVYVDFDTQQRVLKSSAQALTHLLTQRNRS
ncbi:beta-glucosidase [Aestuariibacter halophilus]|uniref:Beta-glucosidase n=1 Tax=Fluctibacter halophilus TaxID=226011 RepID=A0ABS8G7S4_9ALTE|nr:GH1 family beta-glucosidase [Aestuariibacter halophilus]MCC2616600.1 beta-glucosidase [Aestuariibacter halophilus]